MMKVQSQFMLAFSVLLVALYVVASATPASAHPSGTTFSFATSNFQGDGADPAVPFGVPTSIPGSGVTVDSMISTSPAVPGLTEGGLEFVDIWITTDDGGFLNGDSSADSAWFVDGLDYGPDEAPAVKAGLIFLSFDIDGTYVDLSTAFGIPIVPHPITGQDTIPLDVAGDDASFVPYDTAAFGVGTLGTTLALFGVPFGLIPLVNGMHVGFEVTHIPEPASLAIAGLGMVALAFVRRRRK